MDSSKTLKLLAALFLCTTIISSSLSVYYYYQFSESEKMLEEVKRELNQRDQVIESISDEVRVIQQKFEDLRSRYEGLEKGFNESSGESAEVNTTLAEIGEEISHFNITVDLLIDYGNGTFQWFNDTEVQIGSTLFNVTSRIAEIDYTLFEIGVFVDSINGVGKDQGGWWIWYYYDEGWEYGPVGSTQWILKDGEIISWIYNS